MAWWWRSCSARPPSFWVRDRSLAPKGRALGGVLSLFRYARVSFFYGRQAWAFCGHSLKRACKAASVTNYPVSLRYAIHSVLHLGLRAPPTAARRLLAQTLPNEGPPPQPTPGPTPPDRRRVTEEAKPKVAYGLRQ